MKADYNRTTLYWAAQIGNLEICKTSCGKWCQKKYIKLLKQYLSKLIEEK